MNCGMTMVKYILFIFNLLCALSGILISVIGGILFAQIQDIENLKGEAIARSFPIVLIVLGSLIFIIAFFGCCGAIRESECMSMTYAVLLFVLLVLDIALVALIFTTETSQREISEKIVRESFKNHNSETSPIHLIEREWQCCGVNGPGDYSGSGISSSCCKPGISSCNSFTAYQSGCMSVFTEWVTNKAKIISYVGIGIIIVELVGFIFACCLANNIRNHRRRSSY